MSILWSCCYFLRTSHEHIYGHSKKSVEIAFEVPLCWKPTLLSSILYMAELTFEILYSILPILSKNCRKLFYMSPTDCTDIARMGFEDNNLDNLFQQLATESYGFSDRSTEWEIRTPSVAPRINHFPQPRQEVDCRGMLLILCCWCCCLYYLRCRLHSPS